jgi:hypothetical protein
MDKQEEIRKIGIIFIPFNEPKSTIIGGKSNKELKLNIEIIPSNIGFKLELLSIMFELLDIPRRKKINAAKNAEGNVVTNIDRICVVTPTLVAMAAKLVVSDRGDNLSPKYAPPIIAPAVIPISALIINEILIITTPIVPIEPHEVPVNEENIMVKKKAITYI